MHASRRARLCGAALHRGLISWCTRTPESSSPHPIRLPSRRGSDDANSGIGKRQVESGRVRVRSYVVETPVQEQVNLRAETVHVERRPVNRAATATDGNLFQDRTIEATEHDERAVVSKEARVTEELVVKKDVEQRTETIRDKVRHTEVKVDDERAKGGVGKTASTSTPETTPKR